MNLISSHRNGEITVEFFDDETRVMTLDTDDSLPHYPVNVDIRLSTQCSLGYNPKTKKAVCSFCHESATTSGREVEYKTLKQILCQLPDNTELAVGINGFTPDSYAFLDWASRFFRVAITLNQLHLNQTPLGCDKTNWEMAKDLSDQGIIRGMAISFRDINHFRRHVPPEAIDHPKVYWQMIVGIDSFHNAISLQECGVKTLSLLGEKDMGMNAGKVDLESPNHRTWRKMLPMLMLPGRKLVFDTLGVEQLQPYQYLTEGYGQTHKQPEWSIYIDGPNERFMPSSRSLEHWRHWESMTIEEYFKTYKLTSHES